MEHSPGPWTKPGQQPHSRNKSRGTKAGTKCPSAHTCSFLNLDTFALGYEESLHRSWQKCVALPDLHRCLDDVVSDLCGVFSLASLALPGRQRLFHRPRGPVFGVPIMEGGLPANGRSLETPAGLGWVCSFRRIQHPSTCWTPRECHGMGVLHADMAIPDALGLAGLCFQRSFFYPPLLAPSSVLV